MSFGGRLKSVRIEHGFSTRAEFAKALNIPVTTLRNYEMGVREPGHKFIREVSKRFNISADYLLGLSDDKDILKSFRLNDKEALMVCHYRDLDDHGVAVVDFILTEEYRRCVASRSGDEPDVDAALERMRKNNKNGVAE